MKKLNLMAFAILGIVCPTFSQYTTINYDLEKNYFNEGQALPAEKPLMFTGLVPPGIDIIEISILPAKAKSDKDRLYLASWKDFDNKINTSYSLAVNYPLRASEKYDFRIDFYRQISSEEREQLSQQITAQVSAHLDANINLKGKKIELAKKEKRMVAELERIIRDALSNYRSQQEGVFTGLSTSVRQKLAQLGGIEFASMPKDSTAQLVTASGQALIAEKIAEVKAIINTDIRELIRETTSQLSISRYIDDYGTEQKKGFFSLSFGYGGVYLAGPWNDFSYGAAPYAGVAFPLSNSTIAPQFLRNSSVVFGVFMDDFEDDKGNVVTGMIVGRPVYLGLDYKLFEFVRFNAGAVFLEKTEMIMTGTEAGQMNTKAFIRPFIGLSARIDLSIGFGK